ncbi:MAG: hypothetical protein II375_06565 [Bacteroidales bacterium]|nr:hypothetical protein [Bacteroidales bacterium]
MKLRNLKKDVLFLAQDLTSIISVKLFFEGIEAQKLDGVAAKVFAFKSEALAQINAPGVSAKKPFKSEIAKAKRLNSEAAVKAYLAAKNTYSRELSKAYAAFSKNLFEKYADLSEEISKVK